MRSNKGLAIPKFALLTLAAAMGCGGSVVSNAGDQPLASETTPSNPAAAGSLPQTSVPGSPGVDPAPQVPSPSTVPAVPPGQDPIPAVALPPIQFDRYHTQQEIASYFQAVAAALPDLAKVQVLGKSQQGRDVFCLVLNCPSVKLIHRVKTAS